MNKLFIDTHAVVWLAEGKVEAFSDNGAHLLSSHRLFISPIVRLELQYLFEIGRFLEVPAITLSYLHDKIDLQMDDLDFDKVIGEATRINWTRDVFDRLITAQALYHNAPLLTKDTNIKKHYALAEW